MGRLEASTVDKDVSQRSVVVGGSGGGGMVVTVPALTGGTEVPRRGRLCGGRPPVVGLMFVEVLGGPVESQLQIGWLYPECTPTLRRCVPSGSRRMWVRFRRWHEGFADFTDILSRYVESFSPLFLLHLPPVLIGFLDQHVAFPLVDGNEAVLGLVFIVVVHLDVDLARGNRQFRHDASDCTRGSSLQEDDVY